MISHCPNDLRQINGFENYWVSYSGDVFRLLRVSKKFRLLKKQPHRCGYLTTTIFKNSKPCIKYIHRLVAAAFLDNPKNKPEVNHIDGNKKNNKVGNLEWVTKSENIIHAGIIGAKHSGCSHPAAKLTKEQVWEILDLKNGKIGSLKVSRLYGVSKAVILMIWNHKKYKKEITAYGET